MVCSIRQLLATAVMAELSLAAEMNSHTVAWMALCIAPTSSCFRVIVFVIVRTNCAGDGTVPPMLRLCLGCGTSLILASFLPTE